MNLSVQQCSCPMSRRSVLAGCVAGCFGASAALAGLVVPKSCMANNSSEERTKIRVVFLLTNLPVSTWPDWPHVGFDARPTMERMMNALTTGCPEIEFVESQVCSPNLHEGGELAKEIVNDDLAKDDIDGYVVVQINLVSAGIHSVVASGKPVLYADHIFGGSHAFLTNTSHFYHSKTENVAPIASSSLAHLVAAAKCLPLAKTGGNKAFTDAVAKLRRDIVAGVNVDMKCIDDKFDMLSIDDLRKEHKTKKILEFEQGWGDIIEPTKEIFGINVIRRSFTELHDLWTRADKDQAMEIVKRWQMSATDIVDVSGETLEKSARMYLAMKQCLKNHGAESITINCFGGFMGGSLQAYPCLGFLELLNEGLIGACECDILSTLTMTVMTTLTKGRPGFISDPVMDIASKQITYAHCVASTKALGPKGPSNPYAILTHNEDRAGASVRSMLPSGYMTTTLQMQPIQKMILFHQAKAVGNDTRDYACRTKLAAVPVGDFEKLMHEGWAGWGWHRVTFYGDLKEPVFALADALGWKVIEEA